MKEASTPLEGDQLPKEVQDALNFERDLNVDGPVSEDPFYSAPAESQDASPGSVLRVDNNIDPSKYLIPPSTAISRLMYQSEDSAGRPTPVSAFILWPYFAHKQPDGGLPVVAWAHGTSSITPEGAPSKMRHLWQHWTCPYHLALQGYVVVGTDYAGLGVGKSHSGETIPHEYLNTPCHAHDVVYSVQAARIAYPRLSKDWLAVGHSQGGGAVWAVAERQAQNPLEGYLGAVPIAPVTRITDGPDSPLIALVGTILTSTIKAADPSFNPDDLLTPAGTKALKLMHKTSAGLGAMIPLFTHILQESGQLLDPTWRQNDHVRRFQDATQTGRKPFAGPLLVIFGEGDDRLDPALCTTAVEATVRVFPAAKLKYVLLPQVGHVAALTASLRISLDWIAERFRGVPVEEGYEFLRVEAVRPLGEYAKEQNWYPAPATEFYEAP